jgi:diguanylate cyclase (GGDEF)-like protein
MEPDSKEEQGRRSYEKKFTKKDIDLQVRRDELKVALEGVPLDTIVDIILRLEDESEKALNDLWTAKHQDNLTKLGKRETFEESLGYYISQFKSGKRKFSVMLIDLDNFKEINDTRGHPTGDAALVETANLINDIFRERDIKTRFGGDEFVILLPDTDNEAFDVIKERINEKLKSAKTGTDPDDLINMINFSYGFLEWKDEHTRESFMQELDNLMYKNKRGESDEQ